MDELMKIYGIGPVLASKLTALVDPKKPVREQLKRSPLFETLPSLTQADLIYEPNKQIKRGVIEHIEREFDRIFTRGSQKHTVAGSYRRGAPILKDLDLIIKHPPFTPQSTTTLINHINKSSLIQIIHVFSQGPFKIGAMLRIGDKTIKIDIFAAQKNYVFMLLFATGSAKFNIMMRSVAKKKGYLLNQNGLFSVKTGDQIPISSEKKLFEYLGITFRLPHER